MFQADTSYVMPARSTACPTTGAGGGWYGVHFGGTGDSRCLGYWQGCAEGGQWN